MAAAEEKFTSGRAKCFASPLAFHIRHSAPRQRLWDWWSSGSGMRVNWMGSAGTCSPYDVIFGGGGLSSLYP